MTRSLPPDAALVRAKALADASRAAIHRLALRAESPVTIAELAAATGLHHTAVRQHLAKLLAADLVTEQVLPPAGRGRPRLAYLGVEHPTDEPYRLLAGLLAEAVRTGQTAHEVGRSAGARWARPSDDALAAVVAEARRLGFDPMVTDHRADEADRSAEVELRVCPYSDLAGADPATVCSLHLGMAEGLAERIGGLVVDGLDVASPSDGGCRLRLHHT